MVEKKRIEFIDLAKGVCIFMVVLVHVIPEFGENFPILTCLRMPLYFCLSGLFFKDYGGIKGNLLKKTNKILIPFVAWYLIGYAIYYTGRFFFPSDRVANFYIDDIFFHNEIFNVPIWFLLCLFWSNLFFSIIVSIFKKWYTILFGVSLFSFFGWLLYYNGIFNFLYLGSSLTCLPFFYMGYALKRSSILYPSSKKGPDFLIMAICLTLASLLAFIPEIPPRLNYSRNEIIAGNPVTIYLCAAFLVAGVLLMCKFIGKVPFLTYIGRYSIIVLVSHMILNDLMVSALHRLTHQEVLSMSWKVLIFVVVMSLMLIIIPFFKKYLSHITAQKDIIDVDKILKKNENLVSGSGSSREFLT